MRAAFQCGEVVHRHVCPCVSVYSRTCVYGGVESTAMLKCAASGPAGTCCNINNWESLQPSVQAC